jgi:AcrR family transcriptional regulator
LIEVGIALATEGGVEAVTIAAVAKAAGIKGPSLYKHFASRQALLTAIEVAVLHDLEAKVRRVTGETPRQRVIAIANAYRAYWQQVPRRYSILFRMNAADDATLAESHAFASRPLFEQMRASGIAQDRVQYLTRTLVAFLHGFVSIEIAQGFRLGGNLDEGFLAGLEAILKELEV